MSLQKEIVDVLSEDKALEGHSLITELLNTKAINMLKEAKKILVAKTYGTVKESSAKDKLNKSKRSSFREKMHKLKFGGASGAEGKK